MKKEKDCKQEEKYLTSEIVFSNEFLNICKNESIKRVKEEFKDETFKKFINWKKNHNEIAIYTTHAYADFSIPKNFNCIFNVHDPTNHIFINFKITQSIFNATYPINSIEHGHRHICILEFETDIPKMFEKLYVAKEVLTPPINTFRIGICDKNDFESVRKYLKIIMTKN